MPLTCETVCDPGARGSSQPGSPAPWTRSDTRSDSCATISTASSCTWNNMHISALYQYVLGEMMLFTVFKSPKKRARGMCTNLDAGARAGAVPFLQHESIGASCVFTVFYGKAGSVGWVIKQSDQRNASTSEKRGSTTKPKYSHVYSKQHAEIYLMGTVWGDGAE
jgi:hypothetical protein